ncbi:MAG: ABC transporter permease subunit [Defluviitaleaceae bacterium]|nr:ABC transporter permease subunit [Defluviitaleaceae bacterium]
MENTPIKQKKSIWASVGNEFSRNWQLYTLLIIPVAYILIFHYYPMLGLQIAFKDYRITMNMWEAPVHPQGMFHHFRTFLNNPRFWEMFNNTIILSLYSLVISAIMPVLLALIVHNVMSKRFKRSLQMVTYAPFFISAVVMVGILSQVLSVRAGFVNNGRVLMGLPRLNFFAIPEAFRHMFVWSDVWQSTGYSAIIYIAALSGVDPQLHEAAKVDGASKFKRLIHVDLPGIMPTFIILLILATGRILDTGHTRVLLFQNALNISHSRVIDTYLFERGLGGGIPGVGGGLMPNYPYAAAIGMTKSLVGLVMILIVNRISRKVTETSLW